MKRRRRLGGEKRWNGWREWIVEKRDKVMI